MSVSVLNYVAIFSFLSFVCLLGYVLVKCFKLHVNLLKQQNLHFKTAVIFATGTAGVYLRKLKYLKLKETHKNVIIKICQKNIKNINESYFINICDVPLQNYNIF